MISLRGSRPKMASDSSTEPASLPSSVVTFNFISHALLLGRRLRGSPLLTTATRQAGLARLRCGLRQCLLGRIAHRNPAALRTGHRAFDQDQAARDVGLHNAQIERGDAIDTHVTGHLLVLEPLAGILPSAGRTDRTMRDRDPVGGAQAAEIPALHAARVALADRGAGDIDKLANHEMVRLNLSTDRDQRVFRHPEFRHLALGLDLGHRKLAALCLGQIDGLAAARSDLQSDVAILLTGAMTQYLAIDQLH